MKTARSKSPVSKKRRGINIQTYLERERAWKASRGFEPIDYLKRVAVVHFAISCKDPKKIDQILEVAGINTDPNQRVTIRL